MSNLDLDVRHRPAAVHLDHLPSPPAHVGLADRLWMSVGLWLLVRSVEHARHRADPRSHSRLLANELLREQRELAFERERLQWPR